MQSLTAGQALPPTRRQGTQSPAPKKDSTHTVRLHCRCLIAWFGSGVCPIRRDPSPMGGVHWWWGHCCPSGMSCLCPSDSGRAYSERVAQGCVVCTRHAWRARVGWRGGAIPLPAGVGGAVAIKAGPPWASAMHLLQPPPPRIKSRTSFPHCTLARAASSFPCIVA